MDKSTAPIFVRSPWVKSATSCYDFSSRRVRINPLFSQLTVSQPVLKPVLITVLDLFTGHLNARDVLSNNSNWTCHNILLLRLYIPTTFSHWRDFSPPAASSKRDSWFGYWLMQLADWSTTNARTRPSEYRLWPARRRYWYQPHHCSRNTSDASYGLTSRFGCVHEDAIESGLQTRPIVRSLLSGG